MKRLLPLALAFASSAGALAAQRAQQSQPQEPQQQDSQQPLPIIAVADGAEQAPFVALVREQVGAAGAGDYLATIWSVDPEARVVERRRVLGPSPWSASPLFGAPGLLRWQVADRDARFRVLRLHGASFAVEELLRSRQLRAIGDAGSKVYLRTAEGPLVVDVDSGAPRAFAPDLQVLATHGTDWLVAVDGKLARFDAAAGSVRRSYEAITVPGSGEQRREVHWDGGRFVVMRGNFVDERRQPIVALPFAESAVVYRELSVCDLQLGTATAVVVRTQASGGSGIGVIPVELKIELVGGLLRYTERRPATGASANLHDLDWERDMEWVTIDVATGEQWLRRPYRVRVLPDAEVPPRERVPEDLRELFVQSPIRAWGIAQDLAWAMLRQHDIAVPLNNNGVIKLDAVCRTADGNRLLVLHRGTFYCGDLAAGTVAQWPAPAALAAADVELHELRAGQFR